MNSRNKFILSAFMFSLILPLDSMARFGRYDYDYEPYDRYEDNYYEDADIICEVYIRENEELQYEYEELQKENERLKSLLKEHDVTE